MARTSVKVSDITLQDSLWVWGAVAIMVAAVGVRYAADRDKRGRGERSVDSSVLILGLVAAFGTGLLITGIALSNRVR